MGFLYNAPQCSKNIFTVGDAIQKLQAFNAVYEAGKAGSVNNCAMDDNEKANWRNAIRENVIHCGGDPTDLNFFYGMAGGPTMDVDATDLYIKYDCDRDYNIFSSNAANGASPGASAVFTLQRSMHSKNGKYSKVSVNGNIYIYEDRQWVRVTAVDTSVDYAHTVTVIPFSKAYTANIRKGKKMVFNPIRYIDGYSCPANTSTWDTPGYIMKVQPFRVRGDWETPFELDRPYQDILQFAMTFDNEGLEVDSWTTFDAERKREEMMLMENLAFFIGQKIDNPALLALVGTSNPNKYGGFDGYLNTLRYGGGTIYDFDPANGFDLDSDMQAIIQHQDATKRTKEFVGLMGINFNFGMNRRFNDTVKNYSGQCTFDSFRRAGADGMDMVRLGVQSMKWMNYTLHFREISAMSDTRLIGNYDFPNLGILMPGTGLKDSKGRSVPAIEFYKPNGSDEGMLSESVRNNFLIDGCEKVSGSMIRTWMMATHCPGQHILLNPVMSVA